MEAALRILENDGLLVAQGAGNRRRIVVQEGTRAEKSMRVAILAYEPEDRQMHYIVDLAHQLAEAGQMGGHWWVWVGCSAAFSRTRLRATA